MQRRIIRPWQYKRAQTLNVGRYLTVYTQVIPLYPWNRYLCLQCCIGFIEFYDLTNSATQELCVLRSVPSKMLLCCHWLLCCCVVDLDVHELPDVPQHEPCASLMPASRSRQLRDSWRYCSWFVEQLQKCQAQVLKGSAEWNIWDSGWHDDSDVGFAILHRDFSALVKKS